MSPSTLATRYLLDTSRSRFTVQAFASGLLAGFGHNPIFVVRDFAGELIFSPDQPGDCSYSMTVQSPSLQLSDGLTEHERQEIQRIAMDEVLEVAKYPDIAFRSTKILATNITPGWFRAQIKGLLRLHGIIRHLPIDAQLRFADRTMQLSGDFTINFRDFNIKAVAGTAGLIKVKDELKFQFNLLGQEKR